MFRLTLAQMRLSLGRLTAAGIAVLIGTAFVAATLLAGDVIRQISTDCEPQSLFHGALVRVHTSSLRQISDYVVISTPCGRGTD